MLERETRSMKCFGVIYLLISRVSSVAFIGHFGHRTERLTSAGDILLVFGMLSVRICADDGLDRTNRQPPESLGRCRSA